MTREKRIFEVESITELPCWQGAKQCWCEVECENCIESHLLAAGWRKQSEVAREIFKDINAIKKEYASGNIDENELYVRLYMLEKKYMEGNYD